MPGNVSPQVKLFSPVFVIVRLDALRRLLKEDTIVFRLGKSTSWISPKGRGSPTETRAGKSRLARVGAPEIIIPAVVRSLGKESPVNAELPFPSATKMLPPIELSDGKVMTPEKLVSMSRFTRGMDVQELAILTSDGVDIVKFLRSLIKDASSCTPHGSEGSITGHIHGQLEVP